MSGKGGRHGKYHKYLEEEGMTLLEGWARDGLTDEQIAHNIGIHVSTLYIWKNKYTEIDEALKKGKEVADYEVENALFRSAIGYQYEEIKQRQVIVDGQMQKTREVVTRHVAPNSTSIIFWLKNRKPELWRNKATKLDIKEQELQVKLLEKQLNENNDTEDQLANYFEKLGEYIDES